MNSLRPWQLPILAALLMALGWPPFNLWPLSWFGMALFAWPLLREELPLPALRRHFVIYTFAVNLFGFYWLAYTFREFGDLNWVVATLLMCLVFALLCVFPMLWVMLWPWLSRRTQGKPQLRALALMIFLILWDFFDLRFFPWAAAQNVGSNKYLLASVYYLGSWGWRVLFFVSCVGMASAFESWRRGACSRTQALGGALIPSLMSIALGFGVGAYAIQQLSAEYSQRQPVVLLQGNVGNYQKKLSKLGVMPTIQNVIKIHEGLIAKIEQRLPISGRPWVMWPETAFPGYPTGNDAMGLEGQKVLSDWLKRTGGLHVVGTYESENITFAGRPKNVDYNIVALWDAQLGYVDRFRKIVRIPFGEYIPGDEYWPKSYEWLPAVNHFGKGESYDPLAHPDAAGPVFLPLICYEMILPFHVDAMVKRAKELHPNRLLVITNPTNDSWYGPTSEPWQHSLLARWQVARHGLPALRPTNTGLSQVIAPWGEVLAVGPRDESTVIFGELPVK